MTHALITAITAPHLSTVSDSLFVCREESIYDQRLLLNVPLYFTHKYISVATPDTDGIGAGQNMGRFANTTGRPVLVADVAVRPPRLAVGAGGRAGKFLVP